MILPIWEHNMGLMIRDAEIIATLNALAEREGRSRATILKEALKKLAQGVDEADGPEELFCGHRVTYRTYSI